MDTVVHYRWILYVLVAIRQTDVFTCSALTLFSPQGDRVRSRVELVSVVEGIPKMETFDYKSGKFYDGDAPPMRIRKKVFGLF